MNEIINEIRHLVAALVSFVLAYFAPISDMVFLMFMLFIVNMIAGLIAGILIENESFKIKKFFHCLLEILCLYAIVLIVFCAGEKMHNIQGAMQCISGVVYACLWFYGVNILRNLKIINPDSKIMSFLYYVMSFEIVKKLKYFDNFKRYENERKNNENCK